MLKVSIPHVRYEKKASVQLDKNEDSVEKVAHGVALKIRRNNCKAPFNGHS